MMNRRPNLNGSGGPRSIGVPLLCPSNRVLLEREEVSQDPVMASSFRPSAFPSLHVVPRPPPPDDVWSKRPTAAHRKRRDLQSLVPVQDGCRESPGWINSSSSQLPAKTNRRRRNKELSFTEVLKNYKLLPDSRPSSPESLHQHEMMIPRIPVSITRPEGRPSNPRRPTRRPVRPVVLVQPDVQPSRPEGRPSNSRRPTRRPVRPVVLVQPDVQPSRPEGRPSNSRRPTRRPVSPVGLVQPDVQPSRPEGRPSNSRRPTRRPVRPVVLVQPDVQPSRPEGRPSNSRRPTRRPVRPVVLVQPDVQPSRPEGRPSNSRRPTRRPVSPVGLVQPDVQPSKPEGRPSNPQCPNRRPVSPVGLVQSYVQPSRPEGRPSNPRSTTRRKVRPSNPVCPVILESRPPSPVSITTSIVDLVQFESCPAVSLVQPESRPACPLTLEELALSESCSFSNNVFVLSMPKAAQPEEAARGSSSAPRDIIRPEAFVQTGPLLARRAQRDAPPPKKLPKPPVAPRPKLLPSLGQGNVSLVSANAWDERTKKKRKKGVRVQRSSLGLRHIPRDLELAMMRPRLVKSADPSQRPYQPWDDEDEVDIYALRRTAFMCPMYDQEESSGRGNKRVAVEALDNIPFRRKITLCYFMGGRRVMLPKDY
ncbi:PGC-1 and ERR-induced regulator in muscle protein 1-like [Salmo salar]|uniref:PGC-1 and ERR-induced regulator in muscle protein 1-like n=1 Tax=Salmo salar TaxID=8030 RepID=A0A1S3N0Z0_SALSA|nr:PGC-1 and ERR-induced regulator in muscle protein 1-like [Salmo salar]XP_045556211.1 PGC-1 and ERR-induced regulator in muscle protein 1-like [Salmo salar]XP_045556212.1 PGC-1 and ERR-induced regulator in muscle protein 1-like [Salmo salar]